MVFSELQAREAIIAESEKPKVLLFIMSRNRKHDQK